MRTSGWMLLLLAPALRAQQAAVWEFPNFSDRVQVAVANPYATNFDGVAVLSLADLKAADPVFPGTLLLAAENGVPARQVETQLDVARGEFAIEVHLAPHQSKTYSVYTSATLHDTLPQPLRVYASHNYGYNHATGAVESEVIGYRTYGGFFLDVQAHRKGERGLFNTMLGYASITHPPAEGQDVIHLGDTLGLGGLFLRAGDDVYRPPASTPDYAHRTPKPEEPQYRVLAAGPLRAILEESLPVWTIGQDRVALRAEYEMDAAQEVVHCRWWITPLQISRSYEVGAGIRDLDVGDVAEGDHVVTTSGTQRDSNGRIALGIDWPDTAQRAGALQTTEARNEAIVFREALAAGHALHGEYTVAAAWEGSGWSHAAAHVADVLQAQSGAVVAKIVLHETNPNPRAVDQEPK